MRALRPLLIAALTLCSGGCAAIHNAPRLFGGTRTYAGAFAGRDFLATSGAPEPYRLASGTMGLSGLWIPLALVDFVPSLAVDILLLPVSIPYEVARSLHEEPRPPATGLSAQGTNEELAIARLREIALAQRTFKLTDADGDREADYARSLRELKAVREELGQEEQNGYRFRLFRSGSAPGLQWIVTASPSEPGESGWSYFAVDASGEVYESPRPFEVRSDCLRRGGKLVVEEVK